MKIQQKSQYTYKTSKGRGNGIKRKRHATTVKICSNRVKL